MKPSERIVEILGASRKRYALHDIDAREIATLLNALHKIMEILDEHDSTLATLKEPSGDED